MLHLIQGHRRVDAALVGVPRPCHPVVGRDDGERHADLPDHACACAPLDIHLGGEWRWVCAHQHVDGAGEETEHDQARGDCHGHYDTCGEAARGQCA